VKAGIKRKRCSFMDEFPLYHGPGHHADMAWTEEGEPAVIQSGYRPTKDTALMAVHENGPLKSGLIKGSVKDKAIYQFMSCNTPPDPNTPHLDGPPVSSILAEKHKDVDFLIWDLLGRSGQSKKPLAHHFDPDVIEDFAAHGVRILHLPPKGHILNPQEPVHACDKERGYPCERGTHGLVTSYAY